MPKSARQMNAVVGEWGAMSAASSRQNPARARDTKAGFDWWRDLSENAIQARAMMRKSAKT